MADPEGIGGLLQQVADLQRQVVLRERLGEKGCSLFEQAALEHLGGESRHVEHRLVRPPTGDVRAELSAGHPRHLDVGEDEVDGVAVSLHRGQRFSPMARLERLIAR